MPISFFLILAQQIFAGSFPLEQLEKNVQRRMQSDSAVLLKDGQKILSSAGWESVLRASFETSTENSVKIHCDAKAISLQVKAQPAEKSAVFYYGFRKLGFLFPHPRWQVNGNEKAKSAVCEKKFLWEPRLAYRGFHLHTQHPSEWVSGFFENDPTIAQDFLWWLAHNQQNVLQLQMIRTDLAVFAPKWMSLQSLAHSLGIVTSLSISFSLQQQKSFSLLSLWQALWGDRRKEIRENLVALDRELNADLYTVELGTSEFSSTQSAKTLSWINEAASVLDKLSKQLMVKIHTSTAQVDAAGENFNFLPRRADPKVGVLPHTVYLYGLNSPFSPIYGRKNFFDMKDFLVRENWHRATWYYPETSYYVGLDIDLPLYLPVYLKARADDYKLLVKEKVPGQIVFTTGQELGYWLFDWTIALWTDSSLELQPTLGLQLLGEDRALWQEIINWQQKFFVDQYALGSLTASNLMDELQPFTHPLLERNLLRTLYHNQELLNEELAILAATKMEEPDFSGIKNPELKLMMELSSLRLSQAYSLRLALHDSRRIASATGFRRQGLQRMDDLQKKFARYPHSLAWNMRDNPTSYEEGYAATARRLHFWKREEEMAKGKILSPLFENFYSPWKLLF